MNYHLLVHQVFANPAAYSVDMEHDVSLIPTTSSVYSANSELIDEYITVGDVFADLFHSQTDVTKFVKDDQSEQIIQIECSWEVSVVINNNSQHARFMELRNIVENAILGCTFTDLVEINEDAPTVYTSFDQVRAKFPA